MDSLKIAQLLFNFFFISVMLLFRLHTYVHAHTTTQHDMKH